MPNSKQKGNRGEREVVELCKKWWNDDTFMKSPESGGMATMLEGFGAPKDLIGRLAGDLLVPTDFPFCIESKRYKEIDLYSLIRNPENSDITQWWDQCVNDAKKASKVPLLTFREDRKKRYAAIRTIDLEEFGAEVDEVDYGYIEFRGRNNTVRIMEWDQLVKELPKEKIVT